MIFDYLDMEELVEIRGLNSGFSVMLKSGAVPSKFSVWEDINFRLLINLLKRSQAKFVISSLDLSKVQLIQATSTKKRDNFGGGFVLNSSEQ